MLDHLEGVMVKMPTLEFSTSCMSSISGWVKPKTIKLVFAASPLIKQYAQKLLAQSQYSVYWVRMEQHVYIQIIE
jgi:hypothetical protein